MAGSDRTVFRVALAALLVAVLGLLLARLAPSVQLLPLTVGAQAGLWILCGVVYLRRRFNRERPLKRRSRRAFP